MEWKRWFRGDRQPKYEICLTQIVFPFYTSDVQSLDTAAQSLSVLGGLKRLGWHLIEYAFLLALFLKLHYQNRKIAAQNLFLNCKLQLWALAFFTFKVQIFLTRLAWGFPVSECWPRG
jgi:hypothetical protein